jgi:hypothetical protein
MPDDQIKLDLMKQVATDHLNTIPSAKSADPRAFIEAAANWFGKWWKLRSSWDAIASGYCALVLDHEFATDGVPAGFAEKQLFRTAPDPFLGGHIHVSDFSLSRVFRDQGGHTDAHSIWCRLKALNLGKAPCVLFDPHTGLMLLAEQGILADLTQTQLLSFDGTLTVPKVDMLIDGLYVTSLKYPETFPHVWRNKDQFVPTADAEKLYQGLLFIHLRAHTQGTCLVVREDQTNAGRTDLTLTQLTPQVVFVIEMKVLKSFQYHPAGKPCRKFSHPKNQAWADSGIDQVCEYRTARQADEAFLLLYDMRMSHKPIKKVISRCKNQSVLLRKYDIFNAAARDIRAAKPKRSKTR